MIGITLYRVAQSALANVLRHSGARTAEVELDVRADAVALEIRDDVMASRRAHRPRSPGSASSACASG